MHEYKNNSQMKYRQLITTLLFVATIGCSSRQPEKIFNGKDLSNWNFVLKDDSVPTSHVFSADEGIITVKGEPLGYMYTRKKYRDFTLELEYRWANEASNSGVFFLIEEPATPFPKGIECQLKAGKAGDLVLLSGAVLKEYVLPEGMTERPKFPVVEKKEPSSEKPAGEWNKVKIQVKGGIADIYINDVLQNSATSEVKEGHIGLQSEGKEIQFRNLVIE
jgi:hypothetical protein